jgi:hypothetical protein
VIKILLGEFKMVEYIYFVKCPNCDDEPFDFFDEAKAYALGCLNSRPVITQIEVDRNDFGECTDSHDLGTVWSWETMMDDIPVESDSTLFTKDDFCTEYNPETDPEFIGLDDDIDVDFFDADSCTESVELTADELRDKYGTDDVDLINAGKPADERVALKTTRMPIPENMSIKDLVEAMEENEDTVECTWCEDLFDKSECRYEVDLGYLCSRCEAAIKSRGETLTFRENNYWDFLDEDVSQKDTSLNEDYNYNNFGRLEPNEIAKAKYDILLDLYCDDFAADYVDLANETVKVPYMIDSYSVTTGKKNGYKTTGNIVDFNLEGNRVILTLDSGTRQDLEGAFTATSKDSITRRFLNVFEPIVRQVNRKYKIALTILFERDLIKTFKDKPQFANVLAKYITDITFTVPLINESPYDEEFAKAIFADGVELDSEAGDAARKHLENLCDKFFDKPFAKSAFDLGKVINRPIKASDKSYHVNPQSWGNGCEIMLSCPIATLEAEAPGIKDLINSSKTVKENTNVRKVQDSDTSIKSFNLASALIQHFDNDVEFYKHADIKLSYTTDDKKELATV